MNQRIINFSKIVEAILFVSGESVSFEALSKGIGISLVELNEVINYLIDIYNEDNRGIYVKVFNNNVQFSTNAEYAEHISKVLGNIKTQSLSSKAMETLAIIAYKQPITKNEIDQIRGVNSEYSLSSLLDKELITISGKKDVIGNPNLYITTDKFLSHFGISGLNELPAILPIDEMIDNDTGDQYEKFEDWWFYKI